LKALFWPVIRSDADVDLVTRQGFWVCLIVALLSFPLEMSGGSTAGAVLDAVLFVMGGVGIRRRDRFAATIVLVVFSLPYLINPAQTILSFPRHVIFALLLANVRGTWLSARWSRFHTGESDEPSNETVWDKISGSVPSFLWPKIRLVFYAYAVILVALVAVGLLTSATRPLNG
jgi:hypothetical protein